MIRVFNGLIYAFCIKVKETLYKYLKGSWCMNGKINFDAATKGNPGISTCAIVIKEDDQHHTFTHNLGEMDNHSAEWAACIFALEHARELNVRNALLYTDSKLIADSIDAGYVKMPSSNLILIK